MDITRNRHKGNTESTAAFERAKDSIPQQRFRVLQAVREASDNGITCRELADRWGVGMNAISGRFSELKLDEAILKTGVRDRCAVYKINE